MEEKQAAPVGYSAPPGYNVPPQQNYPQTQQPYGGQAPAAAYTAQGNVVVVQGQQGPPQSFTMHILFGCFVMCCCGCLFGLIGMILAFVAKSRAASGLAEPARSMGKASMGVSIAGLVIGLLTIVIVVVLYFTMGALLFHHVQKALSCVGDGC